MAAEKLGAVRRELDKQLVPGSAESSALRSLQTDLAAVSKEVAREESLLQEITSALDEAAELKAMKEVLDRRWETFDAQMSAMYESISLGLTAEALSHRVTQHRRSSRQEELYFAKRDRCGGAKVIHGRIHRGG